MNNALRNIDEAMISKLRDAVIHATQDFGLGQNDYQTFLSLHIKRAISSRSPIVIAEHGAGKSYWIKKLQNVDMDFYDGDRKIEFKTGFIEKSSSPLHHPDAGVFHQAINNGFTKSDIILGMIIGQLDIDGISNKTWLERIQWISRQDIFNLVKSANESLERDKKSVIFLFDDLATLSTDINEQKEWMQSVIDVITGLHRFRNINPKIFVRSSSLTDITYNKAKCPDTIMYWTRRDTHKLLLNSMIHDPLHGDSVQSAWLREYYFGRNEEIIHSPRLNDGRLLDRLISDLMPVDDPRRPVVSSTIHGLSDGNEIIEPARFMSMINRAALMTTQEDGFNTSKVIDPHAIKKSIRIESELASNDFKFRHPDIASIMHDIASEHISAPFYWDDIRHIIHDDDSIKDNLVRHGVVRIMGDVNRLDVPELYRTGFGFGRHGGVKIMAHSNPTESMGM